MWVEMEIRLPQINKSKMSWRARMMMAMKMMTMHRSLSSLDSIGALRPQPKLLDEVGALFSDHDGRSVGVAAHQGRHDGGVDDPETADAVDPELRVDDGVGVGRRPHLGGADGVVDRTRIVPDHAFPVSICPHGDRHAPGELNLVELAAVPGRTRIS